MELAEAHNFPQISGILSKYASHLLEKGERFQAIELYRKAGKHEESSKLLFGIAKEVSANLNDAVLCKRLFVLSALEVGLPHHLCRHTNH